MAAAKKSALSNDDIMVEISVTLGTAERNEANICVLSEKY